jgi:hypothetical protein
MIGEAGEMGRDRLQLACNDLKTCSKWRRRTFIRHETRVLGPWLLRRVNS